jgi:2-polyprenyl-6-methoxyphenol hydroxylase-like FAD-dependent oxidoreductase
MEEIMLPKTTEVLIVGAGPTGLALAIALRQAGIDHLIVDKLPQGQNTSRAAVIHAHTLEQLKALGVSDQLAALGLKLDRFAIRDRDRPLVQLHFNALPSDYAYLLMLPQDATEGVLADRLRAVGGMVHRGLTATAIAQDGDGVTVRLASDEGDSEVRARYVVGGDGMHSVVREAAGIAFDGDAYAHSFVLADVHMDWALGREEVSLFFSPAGLVVVAPLPNGTFRIVATLDQAPEHPAVADIQRLIDERGPAGTRNVVTDVVWSSRFRIHHRVAAVYRQGRLLLMGDAAHVHSPAGGQGMNTGLVDAVVLGRLLADVVQGRRPAAALDDYDRLRHPAAAHVLSLAGRLTALATTRSTLRRAIRNAVLSLVNAMPGARRRLVMNLSGLSRRAYAALPG